VKQLNGACKDGMIVRGRCVKDTTYLLTSTMQQPEGLGDSYIPLSLPGWRPRSPEEELSAGNLLEEDKSTSTQGCFPPGLLGTKAEAYGDAASWEAKAALIQHAWKGGT